MILAGLSVSCIPLSVEVVDLLDGSALALLLLAANLLEFLGVLILVLLSRSRRPRMIDWRKLLGTLISALSLGSWSIQINAIDLLLSDGSSGTLTSSLVDLSLCELASLLELLALLLSISVSPRLRG